MTEKKRKRATGKKAPTPAQRKPWDVPPRAVKGDKNIDTLFAAVGRALSAWESLEESISHIFEALVSPRGESIAALRAYGSILTFRGRGEMIQAAADAAFFLLPDDQLHTTLKNLINKINQFAGRRNEIAHGIVQALYMPGVSFLNPFQSSLPAGFIIGPPDYATNKTALRPPRGLLETAYREPRYAYSSAEIEAFRMQFVALTEEAGKLLIQLRQHQSKLQNT